MTETWQVYEPILVPIASEYARKFRKYGVEAEDLRQQLRMWVFLHPEAIQRWESEAEDQKDVDRLVARSLRNEAIDFTQKMKAQSLGYEPSDLYWFSRGELEILVSAMLDPQAWQEPPVAEDGGRRQGDPAVGGNWVALLSDVSRAFAKLPERDRETLEAFHGDTPLTNIMYAEMSGITPQAASARHLRALDKLLKLLGGERPRSSHTQDCECTGARRVMSNAHARAVTESVYDED